MKARGISLDLCSGLDINDLQSIHLGRAGTSGKQLQGISISAYFYCCPCFIPVRETAILRFPMPPS